MKEKGKDHLRIGCAAAFWGDTNTAAYQLVRHGDIDYLVFDYLAEITMSILAKAREKDPGHGYATDFVDRVMTPLLAEIAERQIKVISNAGGVNPRACAQVLQERVDAAGLNLKIAVIEGDDLMPDLAQWRQRQVQEMFDARAFPDALTSMNAYLGATPIRDALRAGADIVITGRIVDSALTLGPLMHEFDWASDDYDRLAAGSLAGHLIECGAQCTGGNFTDWESIPGYENMGFPIAECRADGQIVLCKPEKTGGRVTVHTVAEQLVYEIGDPASYLLPDVICDLRAVTLTQIDADRVLVQGARGRAPSGQYKVCATYRDGYRVSASFMLAGREARAKGQRSAEAILKKVRHVLTTRGAPDFDETLIELLGSEWTYGPHGHQQDSREVIVRISARHRLREALLFLASEIAQAATGMAPGITGIIGGRPKVAPVIRLYSFLADVEHIHPSYTIGATTTATHLPQARASAVPPAALPLGATAEVVNDGVSVPLITLALARSGDKGNHSNIGVIARHPAYLPYLRAALSETAVAAYLQHLLDGPHSRVTRYELPGLHAFNFLLENALGGGGIASLRSDPQGKAYAQQLLDMPVSIPRALLQPGESA